MAVSTTNAGRVIVIGLDGASWNIIEPLVRQGKLPVIEKIMKDGCYGDMESCILPVTFPAWKCYSTGKNPGKLGVYGFHAVDFAGNRLILNNSTCFKGDEIWDIMGRNNLTCGVLDMPTTHPPKAINGFMVSRGATRSAGYTYPAELQKELREIFHYKIEPDYLPRIAWDASIPSIRQIIEQRFEVADYLLRKYDPAFFHLTIFETDTIHHFYPEEIVAGFWELIDRNIGSLLDKFLDAKTYVILMSDHGQVETNRAFNMGKWLMDNNLLVMKKRRLLLESLLYKFGLRRNIILHVMGKTRIIPLLRFYIPKSIRRKFIASLPVEKDKPDQYASIDSIDWERSKTIPIPGFYLYINRKLFGSEKEVEEFRSSIKVMMEDIKEPRTGKAFARVFRADEIYSGNYLGSAPDLLLLPDDGCRITVSPGGEDFWNYSTEGWPRTHRMHGIFAACGAGIKGDFRIEGTTIYDLAPTILHIYGIPIPRDIDGRVLKEIFEDSSTLATREVEYQDADERTRIIGTIKQLKDRGQA